MNRFSKIIFSVLLAALLLVGCKSAEVSTGDVVVPQPPVQETVQQPVQEPAREAVQQPVQETVVQEPAVFTVNFNGYKATFAKSGPRTISVSYPAVVTYDDIVDFGAALSRAYPEYLAGSLMTIDDSSKTAQVVLAYDFTEEELSQFAPVFGEVLNDYLEQLSTPAVYTFSGYGYEVSLYQSADNELTIVLPEGFTMDNVAEFGKLALDAFPEYLAGTTAVVDSDKVYLTFPYNLSDEDMDMAAPYIAQALDPYLHSVASARAKAEAEALWAVEHYAVVVDILGYDVEFRRTAPNGLLINYPSFITDEEVKQAAIAGYNAYGNYLGGSSLVLLGNGKAALYLPYAFSNEEMDALAPDVKAAVEQYAIQYVASLEAAKAAEEARAAAQAAAQAAQAAADKAAAEAAEAAAQAAAQAAQAAADKAAAEAAQAAADKAAAEKAAQEAAAKAAAQAAAQTTATETAAPTPAPAKKSGAGTVILIIVLVLLAAACAYYFLVFRKKGAK